MEQVAGIEPAPSAWKADILAVIRYLHMERIEGIEPSTKPWQGLVLPLNYIRILVLVAGLEPARYRYHGIFLLLYVTIAALLRCSLDYVFTISFLTQVVGVQSLHSLFGTIFSTITICFCVTIWAQQFKIFYRVIKTITVFMM